MTGRPLLAVSGLTKIFHGGILGRKFTAIDDVSFAIPKNTIFGLVGESGCGKTTLARCILQLEQSSSGKVVFDGLELGALRHRQLRRLRRRMQIIFQDPNSALNPRLPVARSLGEGMSNLGCPLQERQKKMSQLAELVGISSDQLEKKPGEFSGGQKQRLVIARALSMSPQFLILDEPVSNLDVSIQAQIINLLLDLKEQFHLTYLFISHDLNLVAYLSDTIAVMYGGRIIELGPAEKVVGNPLHAYTRSLFTHNVANRPQGCAFRASCTLTGETCFSKRPALRQVEKDYWVACEAAPVGDKK